MHVHDMCMCACGGQRTILWSQFSTSISRGGLEDHVQVVTLCSKHLCPLNRLSSAVLLSFKAELIQGYLEDAQGGETEVRVRCNHSGVELDGGLGCR